MTCVVLQGGGMSQPLILDVPDHSLLIDVVRDAARDGGLPLYWRCGQGTCGACVVFLRYPQNEHPPPVVMSGKERHVLTRIGRLSADQRDAASLANTPVLPRLACHVRLAEPRVEVSWE